MNESVESDAVVIPSSIDSRLRCSAVSARLNHVLVLLEEAEIVRVLVDQEDGHADL
jgi:hypothetical protein